MNHLFQENENVFKLNYNFDVNSHKEHLISQNIFSGKKFKQKNNIKEEHLICIENSITSFNLNDKYKYKLLDKKIYIKILNKKIERLKFLAEKNRFRRRFAKRQFIENDKDFNITYLNRNYMKPKIKYLVSQIKNIKRFLMNIKSTNENELIEYNFTNYRNFDVENKYLIIETSIKDSFYHDKKRNSFVIRHFYDINHINFNNREDLESKLNKLIKKPFIKKNNLDEYNDFLEMGNM